jgi:hypothetical protein
LEHQELTTVETAKDLGLLPEEFERIKEILGARTQLYRAFYFFGDVERTLLVQKLHYLAKNFAERWPAYAG